MSSDWDPSAFTAEEDWDPSGFTPEGHKPTFTEKFNATFNDIAHNVSGADRRRSFFRGLTDPLRGVAQIAANITGDEGYNDKLRKEEVAFQAERRGKGLDTARFVGEMLGAAPAALLAPESILGGVAAGTLSSVLSPTTDENFWASKGKQALGGALGGGIMGTIAKGVGKVLAPGLERTPEAEQLIRKGIQPTIGQQFGPEWNSIEQKLQSAPFIGEAITEARRRPLNQFNEATVRDIIGKYKKRSPLPPGELGTNVGHDAVGALKVVNDKIYDVALRASRNFSWHNPNFQKDMAAVDSKIYTLSDPARAVMDKDIARWGQSLQSNGNSPEVVKDILSEIKDTIPAYRTAPGPDNKRSADILTDLRAAIEAQVARDSPMSKRLLDDANAMYAKRMRVENAANRGKEGVFTPGNLVQAIKQGDRSANKGEFARGDALLQDWAETAQKVLGANVPDSGTTGRYGLIHLLTHPSTLYKTPAGLAMAIGAAAQTPERQKMIAEFLMKKSSPTEELIRTLGLSSVPAIGSAAFRD